MKQLFLLLIFIPTSFFAQNNARFLNDQEAIFDALRRLNPTFDKYVYQPYKIHNKKSNAELLTIPVVVHVVWHKQKEDISTQQIEDQIAVLNTDFQRKNADSVKLRSEFLDIAGNANIQFTLEHIERVYADSTFFWDPDDMSDSHPIYDEIKDPITGGSAAWDTDKYMNIWVADLDSTRELNGYAYPPLGHPFWHSTHSAVKPEWDGIVIDYTAFGAETTDHWGDKYYGRTLTHEVGHYLGIHHTFDGGCGPGQDADMVDDTPISWGPAFDCGGNTNDCVESPVDRPNMYENFMDYAPDTCKNTFTKGQVAVMRDALLNYRSGLLQTTTGINTNNESFSFSIYPSPANSFITVKPSIRNQELQIVITDITGKQLLKKESIGQTTLNISYFNDGLYFISMYRKNQLLKTQKVVIN